MAIINVGYSGQIQYGSGCNDAEGETFADQHSYRGVDILGSGYSIMGQREWSLSRGLSRLSVGWLLELVKCRCSFLRHYSLTGCEGGFVVSDAAKENFVHFLFVSTFLVTSIC